MAEARVIKFCVLVSYIKRYLKTTKPPNACGQSCVTHFYNFWDLYHILGMGEARHLKLGLLADTEKYCPAACHMPM